MDREQKAAYDRKYREANQEEQRAYKAAWYRTNRERLLEKAAVYSAAHRERKATYDRANREKVLIQRRNRLKTDIQFRLTFNLRNRLRLALKNQQKSGSAVRDLGCTIPELRAHLEAQFKSGMTWKNWSHAGWHIDHVKPLASFDLTDRAQLLQACHYTNLQPLWAKDNLSKGAKT